MDNPYDSIVAAADGPDPNREALADPRVKSFLDRISKSEGADYNTLVGGSKIDDLSRHPNRVGLTTAAGPSTAFGRYQITGSTDRSKLAKYSHLDYSPENQDLRAVELLRQTKALDAIQQDDDQTAMQRAGREWASIPNSTLPGRKNTAAWNSASAPTSSTNPYDSIVAQADVPTPQRQAQPLPAGLDELSATAAEMNPDASAPAPDVQTSLSAPVTQPVPIQASDKDRQWHLGVTPDEYAKLTRKQKRQVDAAAAYGVNSDNEKRAKGQTEFTPDVNYQNAMRRAVGLPHIGLDPGFNFNGGPKPIEINAKPFTFGKTAQNDPTEQIFQQLKRQQNAVLNDPEAGYQGDKLSSRPVTPYQPKTDAQLRAEAAEQVRRQEQGQQDTHSTIAGITADFLDQVDRNFPVVIPNIARGAVTGIGETVKQAGRLAQMTPAVALAKHLIPGLATPGDEAVNAGRQIEAGSSMQAERSTPSLQKRLDMLPPDSTTKTVMERVFGSKPGISRTLQEAGGRAGVEIPKFMVGGEFLKAASIPDVALLPTLGALSGADEGLPGIIKGAGMGLVYHYGGGITGPYMSKVGNALLWVGAPAAESHFVNGTPWDKAIAESLPMGAFAGFGGGERVNVRDASKPADYRPARLRDIARIAKDPSLVVPPVDVRIHANEQPVSLPVLSAMGPDQERTGRPIVPEKAATIAAQMDAMVNRRGSRRIVVIPNGETGPTKIPKGYTATRTEAGLVIHPVEITPAEIQQIVKEGQTYLLEGHQNPDTEGPKKVVVAYAGHDFTANGKLVKAGTELQTSYTEPGNESATIEELRAQHSPAQPYFEVGGVETAERAVNARTQGEPNEQPNNIQESQTENRTVNPAQIPQAEVSDRPVRQSGDLPEGQGRTDDGRLPADVNDRFKSLSNQDLEKYLVSAREQGDKRLARMSQKPAKGTRREVREGLPGRIERQRGRLESRINEAQAELDRRRGGTDKAPSFDEWLTTEAGGRAGGVDPATLSPDERQSLQARYDEQYYPRPHHSRRQKRERGKFAQGIQSLPPEIVSENAPVAGISTSNEAAKSATPAPWENAGDKLFDTAPVKAPEPVTEPIPQTDPIKTKGTVEYGRSRTEFARKQAVEAAAKALSAAEDPKLRGEPVNREHQIERILRDANGARLEALNLGISDATEDARGSTRHYSTQLEQDVTKAEEDHWLGQMTAEEKAQYEQSQKLLGSERVKRLLGEISNGTATEKTYAQINEIGKRRGLSQDDIDWHVRFAGENEAPPESVRETPDQQATAGDQGRDVVPPLPVREAGEQDLGEGSDTPSTPSLESKATPTLSELAARSREQQARGELTSFEEDALINEQMQLRRRDEELRQKIKADEQRIADGGIVMGGGIAKPITDEFYAEREQIAARLKQINERLSRSKTAPTPSGAVGFKTAKGSTYTIHEDGTTTRDKAARNDVGHEGQSGPQKRSQSTYYVTSEDALKLAEIQAQGAHSRSIRGIKTPDGERLAMVYNEGPSKGKAEGRTVVPFSREPSVGATPIELWNGGKDTNNVHFGNPITELIEKPSTSKVASPPTPTVENAPRNEPESARSVSPETQPTPTEYGASNVGITRERAAAARVRLKGKLDLNQLHDITDFVAALPDLAELGAFHIEAGARQFSKWSREYLKEFSEKDRKVIEPKLQQIFDESRKVSTESTTAARVLRRIAKREGRELPKPPPKPAPTEKPMIAPVPMPRRTTGETARPAATKATALETTGIARRVEDVRRERLSTDDVTQGGGISAKESVERGRALLRAGKSPEQAVSEFKKTGAVSSDAMALVRARHEELAKAANKAFDAGRHKLDNPEFKAAEKARQDWWEQSVRPLQTEWAKTGMAQQGETAIDTGTFYGLYRAFKEQTGREMTPKEEKQAQRLTERVAVTDNQVQDAQKALVAQLDKANSVTDLPSEVRQSVQKFIDQAAQKEARTTTRRQARKALDTEAATIKQNLAAAFQKVKSATGIHSSGLARLDPEGEITKLVLSYAKNRVKAGIIDATQLIDDVHGMVKEFADVSRKEVTEALAGIGTTPRKVTPSEWLQVKKNIQGEVKAEGVRETRAQLRKRAEAGTISPEDGRTIWNYAREHYIDQGAGFDEAVQSIAKDLGATPEQIRRAIVNQPKAKRITDALYTQMSQRRIARQAAERWIKNVDKSPLMKTLEGGADLFFNIATFGHGTVGPLTHAGENIYHPTRWVNYFKNMGRTYQAAYSSSVHERLMQDLVNRPNYTTARRGGLKNEPGQFYDEYQSNAARRMFGAIGKIGNRGFDVLKVMRQDFFDARWNKLDPEQQTPEMAKVIADLTNHATGAVRATFPSATRVVFFAAPLEASRWARIVGDPVRALSTYSNWSKATPSEKYFANAVTKNVAGFAATYLASLALNQAILIASKSDDRVNFTDPWKGDWLRHKIKGRAIESTGGLISTIDFLGKLGAAAVGKDRMGKVGDALIHYGRGKLSPAGSTVADVALRSDYGGRPLPQIPYLPKSLSFLQPDAGTAKKPAYTWLEYGLAAHAPIPAAEGLRDFYDEMRKQGVPTDTIRQLIGAALTHKAAAAKATGIGVTSGATGVKIGREFAQPAPRYNPQALPAPTRRVNP